MQCLGVHKVIWNPIFLTSFSHFLYFFCKVQVVWFIGVYGPSFINPFLYSKHISHIQINFLKDVVSCLTQFHVTFSENSSILFLDCLKFSFDAGNFEKSCKTEIMIKSFNIALWVNNSSRVAFFSPWTSENSWT